VLDVLIRGGTVVDGTGAPAVVADVGLVGGEIALIEARSRETAAETIDATGLVVAPGFIDSHTHLDGQLFWDREGSPSSWHGCTTVVTGNCGFTLAPLATGDPEYPLSLMAGVEQIPRDVLTTAVPFGWSSFAEYIDALEAGGLALNVAGFVGYPVVRRAVMGERAIGGVAGDDDLRAIERLLQASLDAGALGISFNRFSGDMDDQGRPVAGVDAPWSEIHRAVATLADRPHTVFQANPEWFTGRLTGVDADADREQFAGWIESCRVSGRRFLYSPVMEESLDEQLAFIQRANADGAAIAGEVLPMPLSAMITFEAPNVFATIPAWEFLFGLSPAERLTALADDDVRAALRSDTGADAFTVYPMRTVAPDGSVSLGYPVEFQWSRMRLIGSAPDPLDIDSPSLAEVGARSGRHPVDVMLDRVVATGLKEFVLYFGFGDYLPEATLRALRDPGCVLSGNDTGAHLTITTNTGTTRLLGHWYRRHHAFSLEEAVHMLTGRQAEFFELHDRGVLEPGRAADVVIFDDDRIDTLAPELAGGVPGGMSRIVQRSVGIERVMVNGRTLLIDGAPTGDVAGRYLRR
jgi:N-acyl-D-amino-acid deacylase